MIIGACGFTGSGSSAITDYLKEFDTVSVIDSMEFILAHSPDGLEDLDYQLNHHCCKYTSSEVALKRFRMNVKNYLTSKVKNPKDAVKISELTDQYLNDITQVTWVGFGSADFQLKTDKFSKFLFSMGRRVVAHMPDRLRLEWRWFPAHKMEFSIQPEGFYERTRAYVHDVLVVLGADFNKIIAINQPFSGTVPQHAFPFFEDPYAIVVDRDPRDMYALAKTYYHRMGKAYQIPTDTVEHFVAYYRSMRELKNPLGCDSPNILRIRFEDMVYDYKNTTEKINAFCHIREEDRKRHIFDPSMSINNTQVYKRHPELREDIAYIEEQLGEYLFDFERYGDVQMTGKMFLDSSPLNSK